jgi:hypothetical protein
MKENKRLYIICTLIFRNITGVLFVVTLGLRGIIQPIVILALILIYSVIFLTKFQIYQ